MNDKFVDYSIVIEQNSPEDAKIEIVEDKSSNGLNYLRFIACLQAFKEERNRNRRKWVPDYVEKALFSSPEITELLNNGGVPGENGHPVPPSGQVTIERIATIDPNNMSHLIKKFWFAEGKTMLMAEVETLDDDGGPGSRFKKNILQGMNPSFSNRAIIPQRKNADGTIDQTGVGRIVTFDRVILPSHKEAYRDINIPITNVIKTPKDMQIAAECCTYVCDKSNKVRNVIDDMNVAMESACLDNRGRLSIKSSEGLLVIPIEEQLKKEIGHYMMNL